MTCKKLLYENKTAGNFNNCCQPHNLINIPLCFVKLAYKVMQMHVIICVQFTISAYLTTSETE